jgi:2Fe-2S ferredoxin
MPKVIFQHSAGQPVTVDVAEETSVMQAAISNGIDGIVAECGGNCMCATCHVYVDAAWLGRLPAMSADEDALLDGTASDRLPESRLGCQVRLTAAVDGLTVRLPERQV